MEEIDVYWAPYKLYSEQNYYYLYPKPKTLFAEIQELKDSNISNASMLACPAISQKFKNILVFRSGVASSYYFDDLPSITQETPESVPAYVNRDSNLVNGPVFDLGVSYILFSDQNINAYFTPPFFHEPKYTKNVSPVPGEFDIGQWFRPYNLEVQCWSKFGNIKIEEGEPLFYVEIKTDKKINLKQFEITEKLISYARSNIDTTTIFGRGTSLADRYSRFKNIGMRERVLKEIKNNLL
jgi:hypothetical protein